MKIIGILNEKGGVGKSTLTINIGKYLQMLGYKVLVLDTDVQASALSWHAASEGAVLPVYASTAATLKKDIDNISDGYDYVIIDGAGRLDDNKATIAALKWADMVLIPIKPSSFDKWSAPNIFLLIDEVQLWREKNPLKFSLVLNECKTNTRSMRKTEAVCREREMPLFRSRTFDREDYITCLEDGLTVFDINPDGKAANEIREITTELLEFIK